MLVNLSHVLTKETPGFAGGPSLTISPIKEIKMGGSSNSYNLHFSNHLGTHIDCPNHFDENGKTVSKYKLDDFIFNSELLVDIPKKDSELIEARDLEKFEKDINKVEILLIRTKFQRYRELEPERYSKVNPGLSSDGAKYIVDKFPKLKAIGLDIISVSSASNRDEGRKAHGILLKKRDFFIIEDMNLSNYIANIKRIFAIPIFINGVDSSPCTVFAEI